MKECEGKKSTEEYKYKEFGDRLDDVMFRQDISNQELASKMFVSVSTISGYRTGRRSPAVDDLASLATFLHVSADYLIGLQKYP
jgi:transcriptional regulator with XRE-family HTH domain